MTSVLSFFGVCFLLSISRLGFSLAYDLKVKWGPKEQLAMEPLFKDGYPSAGS